MPSPSQAPHSKIGIFGEKTLLSHRCTSRSLCRNLSGEDQPISTSSYVFRAEHRNLVLITQCQINEPCIAKSQFQTWPFVFESWCSKVVHMWFGSQCGLFHNALLWTMMRTGSWDSKQERIGSLPVSSIVFLFFANFMNSDLAFWNSFGQQWEAGLKKKFWSTMWRVERGICSLDFANKGQLSAYNLLQKKHVMIFGTGSSTILRSS